MSLARTWVGWTVVLGTLAACSGKTERGASQSGGEAAASQQPAAGPGNVDPVRAEPNRHLLMVVELSPATRAARTLTARSVDLPLPRKRGRREPGPWRADVLSSAGQVLFSQPLADTSQVRGEFPDEHGQLRGVTAQKAVAAVTLRVPWLAGAREIRIVELGERGDTELGRVAYPQVQP